jgi:carnitine O-acetyltransferase
MTGSGSNVGLDPSEMPQHNTTTETETETETETTAAPISTSVMFQELKPQFDTQVSALSDRDPISSPPTTPATPAVVKTVVEVPPAPIPPRPSTSGANNKEETSSASIKTSVTFGGQPELAPLPIPTLDETLQKFLRSIEALQADEDPVSRAQSKRIAMDFFEKDGPALQELLLEYDRRGRDMREIGSYVEEFWNDSYLAPDSSVVLNLNPFFVLEDSPDPKIAKHPIKRAASLCFASVKMASQLRFENMKPDTFKGKPLCMDQFKALFSTARIPMRNAKDAIHVFDDSNHLAVLCHGKVYYFQVLWPDGHVAVDEGDIADILTAIKHHAQEEEETNAGAALLDPIAIRAQQSIGVLTSLPRKDWAMAREELIRHSPKNEESLKIIDSALFVLVLDEYIPQNKHDAAANMLHGSYLLKQYDLKDSDSSDSDASSSYPSSPSRNSNTQNGTGPNNADWLVFSDYQAGSCCNRWYDKMQIIVCGDGTAGINFEHSAIDGHTALRFVSDVYAETVIAFAQSITKLVAAHDVIPHVISAKVHRAATALDAEGRAKMDVFPKKLHFEIPENIQRKIYYAETALGDEIVASETFVLEFKDYGKAFITSNKLSPDSFVQMSMMLAYYKLYGRIVCAYEPVLTKSFYHGRTEAMRPATMEARHLCQVFTDSKATAQDKIDALRNATKVHSQLVRECSQGKGIDRHLFALKSIAEKHGLPVPAFFHSKPMKLLNHTVLSTSNCGNPALAGFGFGPVVPDGLGIGYIVKDHQLHYSISSKHRQTRRYAYTLESVLRDMAKLFLDTAKTNQAGASLRAAPAQERQHLKSIPVHMISYDSYGDIWGESDLPVPAKVPSADHPAVATSTVAEEEPSSVRAEPPKQRWSAEIDPEELAEIAEEILELKLNDPDTPAKDATAVASDDGARPPGVRAKRRGSKDSIPTIPGRGGSSISNFDVVMGNDPPTRAAVPSVETAKKREHRCDVVLPVPRSHSRLVGPVQRQPSYKYSELSQKGMKIEMDRDAKGGKKHHHHHHHNQQQIEEEQPAANPPPPPQSK